MNLYVVDFETNSLTHSTVIHVMSIGWKDEEGDWQVTSTNDHEHIQSILCNPDNTIVGHFFKMFDVPQVERVLGIKVTAKIYDTLPLSWYVFPRRKKFGLDEFGEKYGIEKPKIDPREWGGPLPGESRKAFDKKMAHRCQEDVKINIELWEDIIDRLVEIYGSWEKAEPFVDYLMFKMDCLADQQEIKARIDMERVYDNISYLRPLIQEKEEILKAVMPPGKILKSRPKQMESTKTHNRPKTWQRKDETISKTGENWGMKVARHVDHGRPMSEDDLFDYAMDKGVYVESFEEAKLTHYGKSYKEELERLGLPEDTEAIREDPNPHSHDQLKKWLFELGWEPKIFKEGANGPVPQLRDEDKNLCESILELAKSEPAIEALDGLTVLTHRMGCLEGFVSEADYNRYVIAGASGFTNTLRLKHVKPIVNLPGVWSSDPIPIQERNFRDGRTVRECIIAEDGHVLCGSDISALEDQTKRHYMWDYDPDYVKDQMAQGYDPHLDLAIRAGAMSEEEVEEHKLYKATKGKEGKDHSATRHVYKTANYSCLPIENTEVLTTKGWRYRKDLKEGDEVLSYNSKLDKLEVDNILNIIDKEDEVIELSNKDWSVECTKDHRWWVKRRVNSRGGNKFVNEFKTVDELSTECNILNSAPYITHSSYISPDEASLIAWILADGHYKWSGKTRNKVMGFQVMIAQDEKYFCKEITGILERLTIEYKKYKNNSGVWCYSLDKDKVRDLWLRLGLPKKPKKEIDFTDFILNMSHFAREAFIYSFNQADGQVKNHSKKGLLTSQNKGEVLEAVKLCGFLTGYKVSRGTQSDCVSIRLSKNRYTTGQKLQKNKKGAKKVFCLTTDNSTFVIRQNGIMTITGNCIYGVGVATLSKSTGLGRRETDKLRNDYWKRNWSIKAMVQDLIVKKTDNGNQMWILNPVNHFWYSARNEKDFFSTLNQGTGSFVFDLWVSYMRAAGYKPFLQYHDEVLLNVKKGDEENCKKALTKAMEKVNELLELNVTIEVDVQFGVNYANVH